MTPIYIPDDVPPAVASATLFTVAEARAFDSARLANVTDYTTGAIEECETRIREFFAHVCGVSFVPVIETLEIHDGSGTRDIMLDHPRVTSVSAANIDGVALTAGDLLTTDYDAGLAIDAKTGVISRRNNTWDAGESNVTVTYTHGYAAVPTAVKRAALILCVNQMQASNLSDRVTNYSDATGSYQLSYAGPAPHWTGIPEVDAVLAEYNETLPGIA